MSRENKTFNSDDKTEIHSDNIVRFTDPSEVFLNNRKVYTDYFCEITDPTHTRITKDNEGFSSKEPKTFPLESVCRDLNNHELERTEITKVISSTEHPKITAEYSDDSPLKVADYSFNLDRNWIKISENSSHFIDDSYSKVTDDSLVVTDFKAKRITDEPYAVPSDCSICLDVFKNKTFVIPCYHSFCLSCIQKWSFDKQSCPLCKGAIELLLHSIDSDDFTLTDPLDLNNSDAFRKDPFATKEIEIERQLKQGYNLRKQVN